MSTTRRLATGLAALAVAAASSACGTGLDAQTYQERNNAESTNEAVGTLAIRNVAVVPPARGDVYEVGESAPVKITVTNAGVEDDTLLEASSPVAREVAVLAGGRERDLVAPALGTTGDFVTLELRGLTRELRTGEYVELRLRFAENGDITFLVPVETTPDRAADRPVYTGEYEEGGEEPALQAPAGGHELEGVEPDPLFAEGHGREVDNEGVVEGRD